jgi:O-antigen/teichoic acid export membrane protein
VRPAFALRFSALKAMLRRGFPLAIISLFVATYVRVDMILLSLIQGDQATGWYSAAQRPVGMFTFLPAAFVGAVLPAMSRSRHTSRSLAKYFEQTVKYLLILSLPLAIGMGLLADRIILLLYGHAYESATPALQILAWTLVVTFINHGISTTLMAVGQEKKFMTIVGWAAAFNVVTNCVFIPLLGHVGASLTTLASEILVSALGFCAVRPHVENLRLLPIVYKPILASMVLSGIILGMRGHSPIILVGTGTVGYVGALLLLRALPGKDLMLPLRSLRMTFRG